MTEKTTISSGFFKSHHRCIAAASGFTCALSLSFSLVAYGEDAAAELSRVKPGQKVSHVTVEQKAAPAAKTTVVLEPKPAIKSAVTSVVKTGTKTEAKTEAKTEVKAEAKTEVKAGAKTEVKTDAKTEVKPNVKVDVNGVNKGAAALKSAEPVKVEARPAVTKSQFKTEAKAESKADANPPAKLDAKPVAKIDARPNIKADAAKDVKTVDSKAGAKTETKSDTKADTRKVTHKPRPAPMLVPPPPPDTPTMIPSFGDETSGLMPMEYMSPELLKKRKQDLVAQLADAKSDLQHKSDDADSVKKKAVQFKTLFEEGVISKRELEASEKEANEIDSSINRAGLRVSELQTLLDGVNGRWDQINNKKSSTVTVKRLSSKPSSKPHRVH